MPSDVVEVKSNLIITVRERGKVVARRAGHNIWLNLGREYLARLIAYTAFSPLTPEEDNRIRYMGLGIGGSRQLAPSVANSPPLSTSYPGTNIQTDIDPSVTQLERPVRVSGSSDPYPGQASDVWLGQVQAPAVHPVSSQTTFKRLFGITDVSYTPYLAVPLSEIMLFSGGADPNVHNNTGLAYDTFDTISKTDAFEFQIDWTVRF